MICTVLTYLQLCRNTSPTGGSETHQSQCKEKLAVPSGITSRCILRTNLKLFTHKPWLQLASVRVITEIWWMYVGRLPINNAKSNKFSALFIREGDIILDCYFPGVVLRLSVLLCLCTSSESSLQIQVIVHSDNTNPIIASTFHPHAVYNFSFSQKVIPVATTALRHFFWSVLMLHTPTLQPARCSVCSEQQSSEHGGTVLGCCVMDLMVGQLPYCWIYCFNKFQYRSKFK